MDDREVTQAFRTTRQFVVRNVAEYGLNEIAVAISFVFPALGKLAADPCVLFCSPGGSMGKGYFDLDADGDRSFSFAQAMADRGWITIAIDHVGTGESTRPEDGYLLHPDAVAAVDHAAFSMARALLREGIEGYPPLSAFRAIGVGHSMGGMLTGIVQARFAPYDAVVVLGSGPYGFLSQLIEPLKPFAHDPAAARREIVPVLRRERIAPYRTMQRTAESSTIFFGGDRKGVDALRAARTQLIVVPGLFTMIPGAWGPDAAAIATPLFLAYGDQDICEDPHAVPALFNGSPDVTLLVLPDTGHSHFVFPSRERLWRRLASWAAAL